MGTTYRYLSIGCLLIQWVFGSKDHLCFLRWAAGKVTYSIQYVAAFSFNVKLSYYINNQLRACIILLPLNTKCLYGIHCMYSAKLLSVTAPTLINALLL